LCMTENQQEHPYKMIRSNLLHLQKSLHPERDKSDEGLRRDRAGSKAVPRESRRGKVSRTSTVSTLHESDLPEKPSGERVVVPVRILPVLFLLPPLSNPVLKLIIMKLEHCLFAGNVEVKFVCLQGLAKIAFLSSIEVKLHLYSFFHALVTGELAKYVAVETIPILALLHTILEAFETYVATSVEPSEDQKRKLFLEISRYCPNLPKNFNPIGNIERK